MTALYEVLGKPVIPYTWWPPRPIYIHAIVICGGQERGFTVKNWHYFQEIKDNI
jgi:hypothetical protein